MVPFLHLQSQLRWVESSCPHITWKTFVYLQGYLYFSLKTTSCHHLLSAGVSHFPSWNPGMHFPPNLLAPNIMLIAARGTFCQLKSCFFSTNPLRMDSHCSWEKDENSQHRLWALRGPEHPSLCRHSPWRNLLTCSSLPSASESSSHCPPSGMFFPPSFFSCCALFKFQDFSWNFAFLETFSRFQRG